MPSLDILEFIDSSHGNLIEPPVAHQVMAVGADPAQSKPFNKNTKLVRIVADADVRISFADDPDAAAAGSPLSAGREMIRVVQPNGTFKLSVVLASPESHEGDMSATGTDSFLKLLHILSDQGRYKSLTEKLDRKQADARAAVRELGDVTAKAKALGKERSAFEAWTAAERCQLQEAKDRLAADREQLESEQREHAASVEALKLDRAALENSWREHEERFAEMQRLRKVLAA
jgi:hypothetical protein